MDSRELLQVLVNASNTNTGRSVSVTFTPAAAAYGANDVISTAKEFAAIGSSDGGQVLIISTKLFVYHTAVISGETSYRLHLYRATPPSAHADNDLWDLPAGDRAVYLGFLELGTPVDLGSTLFVQVDNVNKQVTIPSGGSLWGELVTVGAFTATAAARSVEVHTIPAVR